MLCKDAGIEGQFTCHSLRATTSQGLQKGIPDKFEMELACSAGVFFERPICSRKRHVGTSRGEEEMGRVKGSGEGAGERRENACPKTL